jgi:hypothetical protein
MGFLNDDQSILVGLAKVFEALATIMQFYFYRIDGRGIGAKMVKGHVPCWSTKRNWDSSNACSWKSSANSSSTAFPNAKQTQTINKCHKHMYYECKK